MQSQLCEVIYYSNSLPSHKIFFKSKLKAFADDNRNATQKMKFASENVETLWENMKMLLTSIFSFSHSVFKRSLSQAMFVKILNRVVKDPKSHYQTTNQWTCPNQMHLLTTI